MENFYKDDRGEMYFYNHNFKMKQQIISINKKNVLRGIHISPYIKIITCISGEFLDFVIDLNTNEIIKYHLKIGDTITIPPNYGHLFISLEENSIMLYYLEDEYCFSKEKTIHYRDPLYSLNIPWNVNYIISDKDNIITWKPVDYIIIGGKGFLGSRTLKVLKSQGKNIMCCNTRLENKTELEEQLKYYKPKYIICCTGISTTKWCDKNKEETLYQNVTLVLELCNLSKKYNIHLTIFGTGLVFDYNDGEEYTEKSSKNYNMPLYYSKTRILLEDAIVAFKNVLYLRIQYPISADGDPRCFLSKMKTRIPDNISLSITYLPTMLPELSTLIEKNQTGIYNFVNKGSVHLSKLSEIKKEYNELPKYLVLSGADFSSPIPSEIFFP